MNTDTLTLCLQIAGVLHVGLIWAGGSMPRVVGLRSQIAGLPPFIRRLFWVYYTFIGFFLVGFGLISVTFAPTLASGAGLPRALCAFLSVFWTIRLIAAAFIFDVRPYVKNRLLLVGYHATNVVFVYLPLVYAWAALRGPASAL